MENNAQIYRSPRTLSLFAIGALAAALIIDLIIALVGAGQMFAPQNIDLDEGGAMSIWLLAQGLIGLLEIAVGIAAAVFFLLWLYRCYQNLPSLKAQNTEFTPGWAVGWWFIPFANLVKPFQAVRELWNESDPELDEKSGFMSYSVGTPALLGWWWGFWLGSNFAANISSRVANASGDDFDTFFPPVVIAAGLLGAVAAFLAILVVKNITARQEARFARLVNLQTFAPPPPHEFV